MKKLNLCLLLISAVTVTACGGGSSSSGSAVNPLTTTVLPNGAVAEYQTATANISLNNPLSTTITINSPESQAETQYIVSYRSAVEQRATLSRLKVFSVKQEASGLNIVTNPEPCVIKGSGSCQITISAIDSTTDGAYIVTPNVTYPGASQDLQSLTVSVGGITPTPTPTPIPIPEGAWIDGHFRDFVTTQNLENYSFSPNAQLGNNLYFRGESEGKVAIIAWNSGTNAWTNLTYNLDGFVSYLFVANNTIYAPSPTGGLYYLNGEQWTKIENPATADGYVIFNTEIGNFVSGNAGSSIGLLAQSTIDRSKYKVFRLNNSNALVDDTISPLVFSGGNSPSLMIDSNNSNNWVVVGQNEYYFKDGSKQTVTASNFFHEYSMADGKFIAYTYNDTNTNNKVYICDIDSCHQVNGLISGSLSIDSPTFNHATLVGGIGRVSTYNISYQLNNKQTGEIKVYDCSLSSQYQASCAQVGNSISPVISGSESQSYDNHIIYRKINNATYSNSFSYAYSDGNFIGDNSYGYGYTLLNNNQWQNMAPDYSSYLNSSPSSYSYTIDSTCPFGGNTMTMKLSTNISGSYNSNNLYISNGGSWTNISLTNNSSVGYSEFFGEDGFSVNGNTISFNIQGFYAQTRDQDYHMNGLYFYPYAPQNCTRTFN